MVAEQTSGGVAAALVRARRLQLLTEALADAETPQDVLDAVISTGLGLDAAGANRGLIAFVDEEAGELELVAWLGYRPETMAEWRRFPLVDDLPLSRAVLRREPVYLRSQSERDELFPRLVGRSEDGHALVCLPLVVEDRTLGGLTLSFAQDEEFDEDRRAFKTTLARQVAQALERTRLLEAERVLQRRLSFLVEVGERLSASLGYEETLARVARIAVPWLADWCAVDVLSDDGSQLVRLAVAHPDPAKEAYARELGERYPARLDAAYGAGRAVRTQEPELIPEITDELLVAAAEGDEELLRILRGLSLRSGITVPLVARGQSLGALTLIRSETERRYTAADLELAEEVARRAATAVDNARLFRETRRLADASRALEHVAEAVVLLDRDGIVRYWNDGASRLTGLYDGDVLGRPATVEVPGWAELQAHLAEAGTQRALTVPIPTPHGERWCSLLAVDFAHGSVYTLRDVTDEHALERIRSDFVATASHELRTPLSSIYGAIRTLRHSAAAMTDEQRAAFLEMIETESERLNVITSQLLVAGRLDADSLSVTPTRVELDPLVREVLAGAELRRPDSIRIAYAPADTPVAVLGEGELLRQVLVNVVDNALKYSPGGGDVRVALARSGSRARVEVSDAGIGIPHEAQERIFEKFFRADPGMTLGIGGSGLGLYIARALLRKMDGDIAVASTPGNGSTFTLDLPLA